MVQTGTPKLTKVIGPHHKIMPTVSWIGSRTTADQSIVNSSVFVNVTGLTMRLEAGISYRIRVRLFVSISALGDYKFQVTAPASPAESQVMITPSGVASSLLPVLNSVMSGTSTAGGIIVVDIQAGITTNAAGNCNIQFANNSGSGGTVIVLNFSIAEFTAT